MWNSQMKKNKPTANVNYELINGEDEGSFASVTQFIDDKTNVIDIWDELIGNRVANERFLLVGLHTCGDLTSKCIHLFYSTLEIVAMVNVSCCYHHIEEEFSTCEFSKGDLATPNPGFPLSSILQAKKFHLGRKARMLASESIHRMMFKQKEMNPSLFYRSLLQVMIRDKYNINNSSLANVGRISKKCSGFHDYVQKALEKLGLDQSRVTVEDANDYLIKYDHYLPKMIGLYRLRSILAPVVECVITLDRYCYLREQLINHVSITQICDPVDSPRCYALTAVKEIGDN